MWILDLSRGFERTISDIAITCFYNAFLSCSTYFNVSMTTAFVCFCRRIKSIDNDELCSAVSELVKCNVLDDALNCLCCERGRHICVQIARLDFNCPFPCCIFEF